MTWEKRAERRLKHYLALAATPRGAAIVIAVVTSAITVGAGLLMTVVDSTDFPSIGTRRRTHRPTIDYIERRVREGKSRREATRCLKRYLARNLYRLLEHSPLTT
jgi:hypothetical protein